MVKKKKMSLFFSITTVISIIVVSTCLSSVVSDEILGCGGFVKLSPELKNLVGNSKGSKKKLKKTISTVKVQMLSSTGAVQDETACAPNGYYFLPIYDTTGNFQLRIKGPAGWTVLKDTYDISAKSDVIVGCESDVNFEFTGFSVSGTVGVSGTKASCRDVRMQNQELILDDNNKKNTIYKSKTNNKGEFMFQGVRPGDYSLKFSSAEMSISNIVSNSVKVTDGSVTFTEVLQADGFVVQGNVEGDVPGVEIFLYGKEASTTKPRNCESITSITKLPLQKVPEGLRPLCVGETAADGTFKLFGLKCGEKFTIVPYFVGDHTSFNVKPGKSSFTVENQNVELKPFTITGFAIGGSVVNHNGKGVAGAKVIVEGIKANLVTDIDGRFQLNNIQEGIYNIKVIKEGMSFGDLSNVNIKPSTTDIPPFRTSGYSVCGVVEGGSTKGVSLVIYNSNTEKMISTTKPSKNGNFCFDNVKDGEHFIRVNVPGGTILTPKQHDVDVTGPVHGISFGPSKVSVSGTVTCLGKSGCPGHLSVKLLLKNGKGVTAKVNNNAFVLNSISPGRYTLQAYSGEDENCWGKDDVEKNVFTAYNSRSGRIKVDVGLQDIEGLELKQVGFVLNLESSESMEVKIGRTKKKKSKKLALIKGESNKFQLSVGLNKICVPRSGTYAIYPSSCYNFVDSAYNIKTASDASKGTKIVVSSVRIEGTVNGVSGDTNLPTVTLSGIDGRDDTSTKVDSNGNFALMVPQGISNVRLKVSADNEAFLIYPNDGIKFNLPKSGCPKRVDGFVMKKGLMLEGEIEPTLPDVSITLQKGVEGHAGGEKVSWEDIKTFYSDKDGQWSAGPLDTDLKYRVVAEKGGYNFQAPIKITKANAGSKIVIHHSKLANLKIIVKDVTDHTGLIGVLLSLSGDEYRKNDVTKEDGILTYESLFPGSYFLRPMLKEYEFTPDSKSFELESSDSTVFEFKAKRVAYSIFGTLSTIVGEGSSETTIVAIDIESKESSEAVSNKDGDFRIRGLKPGRKYIVKVNGRGKNLRKGRTNMKGSGVGHGVQTIPNEVKIEMNDDDVNDINFIVQNTPSHARVTGTITVKDEYAKDLSVIIARASNPNSPIKRTSVTMSKYFEFSKVSAGNYVLRVESKALSSKHFFLKTNSVKVNVPSKMKVPSIHTELSFDVSTVSIDEEVDSGIFFTLLFGGLAVYLYANVDWAFQLFLPLFKLLAQFPIIGPFVAKRLPNESRFSEGVGGFSIDHLNKAWSISF
eukprot:g4921.t1